MAVYTTYGPVRGCSGVKHRTREAAEQAVKRDQGNCIRQGTRSDRRVVVVIDGLLYEDEAGREPILSPLDGQKPVRWRPLPVGARGMPVRPRSGL
ncbi:MAG TPA: hypothetical protein VJR58_24405 [Vineibacter sp.]|nr:hypothetical protein [Vineibacter sp.]